MKRTRTYQEDDGRPFDSSDSFGFDKDQEGNGKEEREKTDERSQRSSSRDRRPPSKIQRILKGCGVESSPKLWREASETVGATQPEAKAMADFEDQTLSQRVRETRKLQEKLFTWERMQRIAFEMTKDVELYTPQRDPRDFNVLWRSYVRKLNQANEKIPSSVEPYSSEDEQVPLVEHDGDRDDENEIPMVSDDNVKLEPKQEVAPSPEVESLPDNDGEDEEFDFFMQTSLDERIMRLNVFLRSELYYCYYCGIKYKSERDLFEHCPGITEEDHE